MPDTSLTNLQIAELLDQIGDILDLQGEIVFKVAAYRRAAESIRHLNQDLRDIWQNDAKNLRTIGGVGEAIALKLDELLRTGELAYYREVSAEVPAGVLAMLKVPDVGPKTALRLWKDLGVTDLDGLRRAIAEGKVRNLKGMGEKSEAKILAGLDALSRKTTRRRISEVDPFAQALLAAVQDACGTAIRQITFAGSLRRRRSTIGDLDLLASADPAAHERILAAFVKLPHVQTINDHGTTKASIIARNGMQVDLRVLEPKHWGCALVYFTGSKEHNIAVRGLAQDRGLSLNEYRFAKGRKEIFCESEEAVYETVGLPWIPPELREAAGEIEAAREGRLPVLIERGDLKGDLQTHSTWSDGALSIEEMARAAKARGLKYLAVTDHSSGLGVTRGVDAARIKRQWKEIDAVNTKLSGFTVLKGLELEIKADGSLDMPDEILAQLDICLASTHTAQKQPKEKITARVLKAMHHPYVDAIAHPSGRLIGEREASALDIAEAMRAAQETGTLLELDGAPERMDLDETHLRRLKELGLKTILDSDAHHPDAFNGLDYGIGNARRGWLEAGDVLNTLPWSRARKHLKRNRR
ncbi:MAG: DNA polymerase/3'-5' exonuclease PolX [Chloroflexi bacterium]|nr:DNA polymerase/3'-5' exonuclease PolX [Chloroflexota bacterium]